MTRLMLLALSALMIFIGFGLPFVVDGYTGLFVGGLVVLFGACFFWVFEMKTKKALEEDTSLNKFLKSDGENLIERPK